MYAKKVEKNYQSKSPRKRQEVISKYFARSPPHRSSGAPINKKPKRKGERNYSSLQKDKTELKKSPLKEWLQKCNSPKTIVPDKLNTSSKKTNTVSKFKNSDMCTEALPTVSLKYDEKEAAKRLRKLKYYAARIEKYKEHRKIMDEIEEIRKKSDSMNSPSVVQNVPRTNISVLDCKDMTKADLKNAFNTNFQYLSDILSEKIYSKRHQTFKIEKASKRETSSLSYNVSMIVFTMAQKLYMSRKLNKKFGEDVDYQMKVLLPELCLKIFMDKHDMNYQQAYEYLDETPM